MMKKILGILGVICLTTTTRFSAISCAKNEPIQAISKLRDEISKLKEETSNNKGDRGEKGDPGPTGPKGEKGDKGDSPYTEQDINLMFEKWWENNKDRHLYDQLNLLKKYGDLSSAQNNLRLVIKNRLWKKFLYNVEKEVIDYKHSTFSQNWDVFFRIEILNKPKFESEMKYIGIEVDYNPTNYNKGIKFILLENEFIKDRYFVDVNINGIQVKIPEL